ncbi:MAG: aminotransferase class IV [Actinomycetes bacterium]
MTPATPTVWLGDRLVDPATAAVHWSDHGLTVGDGVFETLKVLDGTPFALTRHLARLGRSAAGLGLVLPDAVVLRAAVDAVAGGIDAPGGRLRITVTGGPGPMGSSRGGAGPTLLVVGQAVDLSAPPLAGPTSVATVPFTRNPSSATAGLKTTSYAENVVALARAEADGASEALFATTDGHLCEGTGSNVFVAVDGVLCTPPLTSGCLAGVTRELVLEALASTGIPAVERDLPISVLGTADEVFLTSTTRDVQAVRTVDGRDLPDCPGPLTRAAALAFRTAYADRLDP